jgi:hypothetical protein
LYTITPDQSGLATAPLYESAGRQGYASDNLTSTIASHMKSNELLLSPSWSIITIIIITTIDYYSHIHSHLILLDSATEPSCISPLFQNIP